MQLHWNTLQNMPIIDTETEDQLGRISGAFMNPENGQIVAFLVGFAKVLTPHDIQKWSEEALQVRDKEALVLPTEILRIQEYGLRRTFLNGKRVRAKSGKNLGKVRAFTLETSTASVLTPEVSKGFLGLEWAHRIFPYTDISEVTERAIILNVDPKAPSKEAKNKDLPQEAFAQLKPKGALSQKAK